MKDIREQEMISQQIPFLFFFPAQGDARQPEQKVPSGCTATAAREAIAPRQCTALLTHYTHFCVFSPFCLAPGTLEYLDRQKTLHKHLSFWYLGCLMTRNTKVGVEGSTH